MDNYGGQANIVDGRRGNMPMESRKTRLTKIGSKESPRRSCTGCLEGSNAIQSERKHVEVVIPLKQAVSLPTGPGTLPCLYGGNGSSRREASGRGLNPGLIGGH